MIKVLFYQKDKKIIGFNIINHGSNVVCSAVSILSFNTINSVEVFTEKAFKVEYEEENEGFVKFTMDTEVYCEKADLLLNSLELGLVYMAEEYPEDICIRYKEV